MSKALEIDSSRRSLLKYTAAGLLAGFGGRLLPHVSSAYAATEGGAKALVVYYSRSATRAPSPKPFMRRSAGILWNFSR